MTVLPDLAPRGRRFGVSSVSTEQWIDWIAILVLVGLAVSGFASVFAGAGFLLTSSGAALLGLAVASVAISRRLALPVAVALLMLVFIAAVPGLASLDGTIAGLIPTPDALRELLDGLVNGWNRILTTPPPIERPGSMLVVPAFCAGTAAFASGLIVGRTKRREIAVIPPAGALVAAVLLGTDEPSSLLLQGSAFAVVAIAWLSLLTQRRRTVLNVSRSRRFGTSGVAMLVAVGALGFTFGPHLPASGSRDRVTLREEPPFDPRAYPSPLSAHRRMVSEELTEGDLRDEAEAGEGDRIQFGDKLRPMITVAGLPSGEARVRVATLDTYDGYVWTASAPGSPGGRFDKLGDGTGAEVRGEPVRLEVTLERLNTVWLPFPGTAVDFEFGGSDADSTARYDSVRYNAITGSAAAPPGLPPGGIFSVDVVLPGSIAAADVASEAVDNSMSSPTLLNVPQSFKDLIETELSELAPDLTGTEVEQMQAIADALKTHGKRYIENKDAIAVKSAIAEYKPGHSIAALTRFFQRSEMVGDDEQYAAVAALFAASRGLPVRIAVGFVVAEAEGDSTTFVGENHRAWVEMRLADGRWVHFDVTPDEPFDVRADAPSPPASDPQRTPPPRTPQTPDTVPEDIDAQAGQPREQPDEKESVSGGFPWRLLALGGIPAALLFTPILTILGLKSRRRRRRRARDEPVDAIAGAWDEAVDLMRDLGRAVPVVATRREIANASGAELAPLAVDVDGVVFGGGDPEQSQVDDAWGRVEHTRKELLGNLGILERWKALLSVTSLRQAKA